MNILARWHQSLDLLLSWQLFTFIKDSLYTIGRTYWLTLKYWWWVYIPLIAVESVIWFLPMGYESLFFNRFFALVLFAGRLFCYFIMIVAAHARDRNVTYEYFKPRLSLFSPLFFTLVIAYWVVLFFRAWIARLHSLAHAEAVWYYIVTTLSIISQYLILYSTELLASGLFIFFVSWVIKDFYHGMQVAFSRAVRMLVYIYPLGLLINAGLIFGFYVLSHVPSLICSYIPSLYYLYLLDLDFNLILAPIPVGIFVTLFIWHSSKYGQLYQED